jgi:hypothetical protein
MFRGYLENTAVPGGMRFTHAPFVHLTSKSLKTQDVSSMEACLFLSGFISTPGFAGRTLPREFFIPSHLKKVFCPELCVNPP